MNGFLVRLALVAVIVTAAGCDSDKALDPIPPSMSLRDFPHSVGNWWVYEVAYTNPDGFDTLLVTVLDRIDHDCDGEDCPYFEETWEFQYLEYTLRTTAYWVYEEQWVCYLDLNGRPFEIPLPFSLGDSWVCPYTQDTIEVTAYEKLRLDTGDLVECFELSTCFLTYTYSYEITVSVAAGVGIIEGRYTRANRSDPDAEPWVAEWSLLDWQVK